MTATANRRLILGTAGHIDHGKTALVRAMTGTDTDRLPEEKQRGITIDIGFAQLDLGGIQLGIVDVPGHERFIKNMLAAASGIDVAMLVVAADDAVMPQTREHLAILRLLDVKHGLVAVTKIDLVEPDWLELVDSEIEQLVQDTFLEGTPVIHTSAVAGTGIEKLTMALQQVCSRVERVEFDDLFRLAIDRSFVMRGVGTVVTGTVWSGAVSVGDEAQWLPDGRNLRARGIESHGHAVESAGRGQRAAINLMGVHHRDIVRGHELATPGFLKPTRLLTIRLGVLDASPWPLKHRARLRLHLGTQQVMARVSLLEGTSVAPGASAHAQLTCARAVVAAGGQPFVLRSESPLITIGGGHVLQPVARRLSRRRPAAIEKLDQLRSPDEVVRASAFIESYGAAAWTDLDLCRDANFPSGRCLSVLEGLESRGALVKLALNPRRTARLSHAVLADIEGRVLETLGQMHETAPLAPGAPRSRLARNVRIDDELLGGIVDRMIEAERLVGDEHVVALPGFEPLLTDAQQRLREHVIHAYQSDGFSPPDPAELGKDQQAAETDVQSILLLCVSQGQLVHLTGALYLHRDWHRQLRSRLIQHLKRSNGVTVSELRQLLGTTRKYAVPIAEYLDRIGFTRRRGDVRVLGNPQVIGE